VTRKNVCYTKCASYSLYFGSGISITLHASSLSLQLAFLAFQKHIPHYPFNSNIQNVSTFSTEYSLSNFRVMSYLPIDGSVYLFGTSVGHDQLYLRRRREDTRPNMALSLYKWLAPSLPFENSTVQKPWTAPYKYYVFVHLLSETWKM